MVLPPLVMLALMGKCAYTRRSLYWNFLVTPSKQLLMWLQQVRSAESCFESPNHMHTLIFLPPSMSFKSMGRCEKSRFNVPCLPDTSTFLEEIFTLTSFGTLILISLFKVFMAARCNPTQMEPFPTHTGHTLS